MVPITFFSVWISFLIIPLLHAQEHVNNNINNRGNHNQIPLQGLSSYPSPIFSNSISTNPYSDNPHPWTPSWVSKLQQFVRAVGRRTPFRDPDDHRIHPVPPFPCQPFNDEDGISWDDRTATQVRHRDIRVIAALGDSISAGFGMLSQPLPKTNIIEYRGKVFSIGGDDNELTLPNLLATVSNDTIPLGAPTTISLPLAYGKRLDRAVSGAIVQDLPHQANSLLVLLNLPPAFPLRNQWKLVTILIGPNNLCRACTSDTIANVTLITSYLRTTLHILRNANPRWIINLMGLFKVSQVYEAAKPYEYCQKIFHKFRICPCILSQQSRLEMDKLVDAYNQAFQLIAREFSSYPLFRVNYQPGFTGTDLAKYGQEFLSSLDCFHPAHNANELMAAVTWNNMLEPTDMKTTTYDPFYIKWTCPSVHNMYIR